MYSFRSCLSLGHNDSWFSDWSLFWIVNYRSAGCKVLRVTAMKSSVFRDIMVYSLVKVSQCLRGTYCLHLQGRRVSQARNHHEVGSKRSCSPCCLLPAGFIILHSIICQKIELLRKLYNFQALYWVRMFSVFFTMQIPEIKFYIAAICNSNGDINFSFSLQCRC
jgi:hypothetical protein